MPVGAAVGVAGAGIAGSVISSKSNSKAIGKATDAQTQSNREAIAAQEKARSENLALQRPLYDAGMPAVGARNALLGLDASPPKTSTTPAPNALAPYDGGYGSAAQFFAAGGNPFAGDIRFTRYNPAASSGFGAFNQGTGTPPIHDNRTEQQKQEDAFERFRNSTGYQFRIGQANDAFNSAAAAGSWLQSGAALRERDELNQNLASAEFGNYWGMLGEQQNLATGAANAMSGVNTTYANNAGNLAVANGNVLANAAIARANNTNAMIGGMTNALGTGVGILQGAGRI